MAFLESLMLAEDNSELLLDRYSIFYPIGGYFENIISIAEIDDKKIILSAKKGKITVCGENLQIYAYSNRDVCIKGRILSVQRCL